MKRIALIIAISLFFIATIAIGSGRQNKQHVECINQEHQLVVNSYSGETLRVSQSFQDDQMLTWRQGMKSPYAEKVTGVYYDISPLSSKGQSLLRIYARKAGSMSEIVFWDVIPEECYDVIYATRSKRKVFS